MDFLRIRAPPKSTETASHTRLCYFRVLGFHSSFLGFFDLNPNCYLDNVELTFLVCVLGVGDIFLKTPFQSSGHKSLG